MSEKDVVELLTKAVAAHMGYRPEDEEFLQSMCEVAEYGADTGWPGFTYTSDCVAFYEKNEEAIYALLHEVAEAFGQEVAELIATFARSDMADTPDGHKNLLAWFALEEVGRHHAGCRGG